MKNVFCCWALFLQFLALGPVMPRLLFGQDEFYGRSNSSSSQSQGDGFWKFSSTLTFQPGVLKTATKESLQSIKVQWLQGAMDELGHCCTLSGRLLTSDGNGRLIPVFWQQFVAVHLNHSSGAAPDWSAGVSKLSATSREFFLRSDGTFSISFDLRDCQFDEAKPRELQVGVSLARQHLSGPDELTVELESTDAVIAQSIQMITIPQPPVLPEIIRLIDRANGWPDENSSAVDLIRAANALRKMKKQEAINALEKYADLINKAHPGHLEDYVIYGLIQCAFEPADPNQELPPPRYCPPWMDHSQSIPEKFWPANPMIIEEDVPG